MNPGPSARHGRQARMVDLLILVLGVGAVALWRTASSDRGSPFGSAAISHFERHNSYHEGGHYTEFVKVGRRHPEPTVRCSCGAEWLDLRSPQQSGQRR